MLKNGGDKWWLDKVGSPRYPQLNGPTFYNVELDRLPDRQFYQVRSTCQALAHSKNKNYIIILARPHVRKGQGQL